MNLFLKCDISGIQSFIFNVPSEGAARELKSRSMYVQSIADYCMKELVNFFEGDTTKELYNGGGNFYLEIETTKSKSDIQGKIDEIQSQYLTSDIFPYISFIEKRDNIAESLKEVNRTVQKAKLQRPVSFNLLDATPISVPPVKLSEISGINGQVPKGDFSWIAEKSDGDKKLAAIKLDVDNLGSLFIGRSEEDYKKVSDAIKDFFNGSLLKLIIQEKMEQNIYVVFSGGDDCFLIGSWNKIFDLAILLRKKFANFQKKLRTQIKFEEDKEITFSAGIIVFAPHYPILQMSEEAEEALGKSKGNKYEENEEEKEKNSINVFGKTITWKEFEHAQSLAGTLTDLIENHEESKGLTKIFRAVSPLGNEMPKVWKLKYFLRRNVKSKNTDIIKPIFNEYEQALLFRYLFKFKHIKNDAKNPDVYLVASRWAELLLKKTE